MVIIHIVEVLRVHELSALAIHVHAAKEFVHYLLRRVAEHVQGIVVEGLEGLHHDNSQVASKTEQLVVRSRIHVLSTLVHIDLLILI